MMKHALSVAAVTALALGLVARPVSAAVTLDFGQFGPDGTITGDVLTGFASDGTKFTLTGPAVGFEAFTQSVDWGGEFLPGTAILWDGGGATGETPGPVVIDFAKPVNGITSLSAEANAYGPYTATMKVYDGSTLLGTVSYDGSALVDPAGSIGSFSFFAPRITRLVISTTDDIAGLAIGGVPGVGSPAPEPATWAMTLVGFLGLGALLRSRGRRLAA